MEEKNKVKAAADHIVELAAEAEASSHAAIEESSVLLARTVLREWIGGVKGVVVSPAFGRVTLIHQNGNASTISSADLAFQMSAAGVTQ